MSSDKNHKIIDVAKMFSNNIRFIPKRKGERHESISLINDTKEILNWKTKYKLKEYIDGQK